MKVWPRAGAVVDIDEQLRVAPCTVQHHQQRRRQHHHHHRHHHPAQYRRRVTRFRATSERMTRVLITRRDPSTAEPRHGTGFGGISSSGEHRPAFSTFGGVEGSNITKCQIPDRDQKKGQGWLIGRGNRPAFDRRTVRGKTMEMQGPKPQTPARASRA